MNFLYSEIGKLYNPDIYRERLKTSMFPFFVGLTKRIKE